MKRKIREDVGKEIEKELGSSLDDATEIIIETAKRIWGEMALTGREAILDVLERAALDTDFMALLAENPQEALQGYGLTWEEKAAISSGDINQIEEWVGKLTPRQNTWLWARLQQERW